MSKLLIVLSVKPLFAYKISFVIIETWRLFRFRTKHTFVLKRTLHKNVIFIPKCFVLFVILIQMQLWYCLTFSLTFSYCSSFCLSVDVQLWRPPVSLQYLQYIYPVTENLICFPPSCGSSLSFASCCSFGQLIHGEAPGQRLQRRAPGAVCEAEEGRASWGVKLRNVRSTWRLERSTWTAGIGSWPLSGRTGPKTSNTFCWPEIRFR